jgi:ribose 5-phosphate isomerase B
MKIFLATDHAGFEIKETVKAYLLNESYEVEDCGAFNFEPHDDYPDFIKIAAIKTSQTEGSFGIVFGKSGAGEAIVANKIKGIRAILGFNEENVRLSREHNNANVLSLGSKFINEEKAKVLCNLFIKTPFSNEDRHIRRIKKITQIENNE